jgi:hypothetical protein
MVSIMHCVEVYLGISTADAEGVEMHFDGGDLVLSFMDWQEVPRQLIFREVLAFRWQDFDETGIRDDTTYEVLESEWLAQQADLQGVNADLGNYAHYKLCFNAIGILDVLARRLTPEPEDIDRYCR